MRREPVNHPFGLRYLRIALWKDRNSPLSLTVTRAEVGPNPGIRKAEVALLAAKDPGMEQGTFFNQLKTTSRPWE